MGKPELSAITIRSGLFTSESNIRRIVFDFSDRSCSAVELKIDEPIDSIAKKLESFAEQLRQYESEG